MIWAITASYNSGFASMCFVICCTFFAKSAFVVLVLPRYCRGVGQSTQSGLFN